jgi:membrane-bound lytic murein transglycosylase D
LIGLIVVGACLSALSAPAEAEDTLPEFQAVPHAITSPTGQVPAAEPAPGPGPSIDESPRSGDPSGGPIAESAGPAGPDPEPAGFPEGPVSVAEVVNAIPPTIPAIPLRFQALLAQVTDPSGVRVEAAAAEPETATAEPAYNVPIEVTPKVEGHMRFFHTAIRDRFEQWLVRLGRYKRQVEEIFLQFDLPSDLVFLSLVESGFNPHAYSRARATGPWQFMQGTAKVYGLRVDQYVDERRDPIKSTVAAAQYLRDLYDLFGAWPLAMAAYNAGEGKVMRALQKTQAKSFSEIARTRHLKKETKEYVPRFMAATIIAKNPDRYGFPLVEPEPHQFDEVVVVRSVHLRDVAATVGVSFEELERLNPELRRLVTPPGENYHLKVPVGTKGAIEPLLDSVKTWKGPLPNPKRKNARGEWYRVRVGDTVSTIAKRFRLSVPELKAKNHLASHQILRPGDRLRIGP